MVRLVFSGGGTGGHVYPALAVANEIRKIDAQAEVRFVGALGKIEMDKVPKAGFEIKGLPIRGLQRKLTLKNLSFPIRLIKSLWMARSILKKWKPDVVVGFGGYASGPTLEMAVRSGIPCMLQEQNSYPGITNKLLAKRVKMICTAYPGMEKFFPSEKLKLTGNPVRSDLTKTGLREEALTYFGLNPKKKTILVFGGSLGARTLNDAMAANQKVMAESANIQWIWQLGSGYHQEFAHCPTAKLDHVQVHPFLERMDLAYAAADLVVCRAGALTISEICLVGKPAILVPSPNVAEDHQTKNAMALVNENAAEFVKDSDAKNKLIHKALRLINKEGNLSDLSENIKALGKPNAAREIADYILQLAKQDK